MQAQLEIGLKRFSGTDLPRMSAKRYYRSPLIRSLGRYEACPHRPSTTTNRFQVKCIFPDVPDSGDNGELRTLTQLVLDICEVNGPLYPRCQV